MRSRGPARPLGAGNGIVAERLNGLGVEFVVGVDLLPEAARAAQRDRPGLYRAYEVVDLCRLSPEQERRLRAFRLNGLITVAALGFGDIPPRAFARPFNLIEAPGWLALTKEDFLRSRDPSGFAGLLHRMAGRSLIHPEAYLRICHRRSITGDRLFYAALVARKQRDLLPDLIRDDLEAPRGRAASVTNLPGARQEGNG